MKELARKGDTTISLDENVYQVRIRGDVIDEIGLRDRSENFTVNNLKKLYDLKDCINEVTKKKWIDTGGSLYKCPSCNRSIMRMTIYCPNCGQYFDGVEE